MSKACKLLARRGTAFVLVLVLAGLEVASARADGAFPDGRSVLVPRDRPGHIILAATFGLLFTEDDGVSWQYACENEATRNGRLYMQGPPPADRLYATSDTGAAMSADGGCTWVLGRGALDRRRVFDVFPDPVDPARVVALASDDESADLGSSAYLSTDGGLTYQGPLFSAPISSIVSGTEIAGTTMYMTFWEIPGVHPRLARSMDTGATWTTLDLEPSLGAVAPFVAAVDPADPRKVYLRLSGSTADSRILESLAVTTDGGETWSVPVTVEDRLLTTFLRRQDGTILVTAGSVVTDGTSPAVGFRSDDGGATFADWPLSVHPRGLAERAGILFVAADNFRDGFAVASSDDGGATWIPRLRFKDVSGIRPCVMESCRYDCDLLAGDQLFPPETCNPIADAGGEAAGGASDGGGCGCATQPAIGASPSSAMVALLSIALALARLQRPSSTSIEKPRHGRRKPDRRAQHKPARATSDSKRPETTRPVRSQCGIKDN